VDEKEHIKDEENISNQAYLFVGSRSRRMFFQKKG